MLLSVFARICRSFTTNEYFCSVAASSSMRGLWRSGVEGDDFGENWERGNLFVNLDPPD